jgi:hypothetical protein
MYDGQIKSNEKATLVLCGRQSIDKLEWSKIYTSILSPSSRQQSSLLITRSGFSGADANGQVASSKNKLVGARVI